MTLDLAGVSAFIGNLWGHVTTQSILLLGAIMPVLSQADQTVVQSIPWLPKAILACAVALSALRVLCPPPPSVSVQPGDIVHVDPVLNTVTVAKVDDIPAAVAARSVEKV